jgi:hypothetical protein
VGHFQLDACESGEGPTAGPRENGNEHSGSIKGKIFLNKMSDYELIKKDSAPWIEKIIGTAS